MIISVPYKTSEVLSKKLKQTLANNCNSLEPPLNNEGATSPHISAFAKSSKTLNEPFKPSPVINLFAYKETPSLHPVEAPLDWVSIVFRFPKILSFPRGNGEPVVIAPGYFTDKRSLELLAQLLKYLNYSVYQLELSVSPSDIDQYLASVSAELRLLHTEVDHPISLIGCSFGGLLCTELQQHLPSEVIGQVVMIGKKSHLNSPESKQDETRNTFINADQKRFGVCINADMCVQIAHALAPSTYKFFQK